MGNDTSVLSEYQVEEIHYAQLGPWTLHEAVKKNAEYEKVTIFTGKLKSYGQLSKEFQRAVEVETLILLKVSFMNMFLITEIKDTETSIYPEVFELLCSR